MFRLSRRQGEQQRYPHPERTHIHYQPALAPLPIEKNRKLLAAKTEITLHKLYDEVSDFFISSGIAVELGFIKPKDIKPDQEYKDINLGVLRSTSRASSLVLFDHLAQIGVSEAVSYDPTEWIAGVESNPLYDSREFGKLALLGAEECKPVLLKAATAIITSATFSVSSEYYYAGAPVAIWTS